MTKRTLPALALTLTLALTMAIPAGTALGADPTPGGTISANGLQGKPSGNVIGTWYVEVPAVEGGYETFYAYHTFGSDGTFTEVSSLLATLTESPAHGVWRNGPGGITYLTFELFAYDAGVAVARIRVRCELTVNGDTMDADTSVDILDLDGTVLEENVASGPFHGVRIQPLPL